MKIKIDENKCQDIIEAINSGKQLCIRDLTGFPSEMLAGFDRKQKINIVSGISIDSRTCYDNNFGLYNYGGCMPGQSLIWFQTVGEMLDMLKVFEKIESTIKSKWTDKQKAVYIYGILRKNCEHDSNILNVHKLLVKMWFMHMFRTCLLRIVT